ncbi:hypothetical protein [Sphingomonas immobilis]|uniref:DUF1570 domain-containing protein n=1 Tax=Sphingomonas immobilis TaxID=3063997 RepID=A0ABT8ZVS9_9SPHN|nr:hypothetical protein [Sphingomonas sp. CA1-15]MDO7840861.1 hypothetical protein [Sphingomonas sp. CA1-15]
MIRKILALYLAAMPVAAQAEWYQADSKHFVVLSNDDPKHLQGYAEQLERFDKAMRLLRGIEDRPIAPVARVTVYIVRDVAEIESLSGPGIAGFYRAPVSGPVAFVPKIDDGQSHIRGSRLFIGTTGGTYDLDGNSVLRHEYSHHFMFDNYPRTALPFWFVEGFAEFHATATFGADGSVTFGANPAYRASALVDRNTLSVRQVLTADTRRLTGPEWEEMYGHGWLLIHYLTFEPSRQGQLKAYLQALNEGKSPMEAASVFGDLDAFQRDISRQILKPKIDVLPILGKAITIDPVTVRKLAPGEAAIMPARIRSKAGVDTSEAPRVLAMARKVAEKFPEDLAVQLELAEAAIDARDNATASAAAEKAIALSPNAEKAYIFKARARMAMAKAAKVTDGATWSDIRRTFVRANRLENGDAEPLMYNYLTYESAGQAPTANAKAGLYTALDLLPDDPKLRIAVILQRVADNEYAEAKVALRPLAFAPSKANKLAQASADLIDALDAKDKTRIDAAIALIKTERSKIEKGS